MELVLPNNYVEIEEEEMMYLDGGGLGRHWYNRVEVVATTIDIVLVCFGIWSLKGASAMKWLHKKAYLAVAKVGRYFGWSATFTGKVLRTVLAIGSIAGFSVGYFIAKAIDGADNWLGGRSWNGYCFG